MYRCILNSCMFNLACVLFRLVYRDVMALSMVLQTTGISLQMTELFRLEICNDWVKIKSMYIGFLA